MNIIKSIGTYKKYFTETNSNRVVCKCSNCDTILNDYSVQNCPECKEKFVDVSRGNRAVVTFVDEYGDWHQIKLYKSNTKDNDSKNKDGDSE